MEKRNLVRAVLVVVGAACAHGTALAEQELYTDSEGTTKITFNVDLIGAAYQSENSWFGESVSFIGEYVSVSGSSRLVV